MHLKHHSRIVDHEGDDVRSSHPTGVVVLEHLLAGGRIRVLAAVEHTHHGNRAGCCGALNTTAGDLLDQVALENFTGKTACDPVTGLTPRVRGSTHHTARTQSKCSVFICHVNGLLSASSKSDLGVALGVVLHITIVAPELAEHIIVQRFPGLARLVAVIRSTLLNRFDR